MHHQVAGSGPAALSSLAAASAFLQLLDALGRVCFRQLLRRFFPGFPRQSFQVGPLGGGLRFVAGLPIAGVLEHCVVIAHAFELPVPLG